MVLKYLKSCFFVNLAAIYPNHQIYIYLVAIWKAYVSIFLSIFFPRLTPSHSQIIHNIRVDNLFSELVYCWEWQTLVLMSECQPLRKTTLVLTSTHESQLLRSGLTKALACYCSLRPWFVNNNDDQWGESSPLPSSSSPTSLWPCIYIHHYFCILNYASNIYNFFIIVYPFKSPFHIDFRWNLWNGIYIGLGEHFT